MSAPLRGITSEPLRHLVSQACDEGFKITRTKKGHLRLVAPNGKVIVASATPSDRRGILNFRSRLRQAGFRH